MSNNNTDDYNREIRRKRRLKRMRRRRIFHTIWMTVLLLMIAAGIYGCIGLLKSQGKTGLKKSYNLSEQFTLTGTNSERFTASGFAADLCVGENSVAYEGIELSEDQNGALFNLDSGEVLYSQNMYEKLYPASMTKIMTGLLALENGTLSDKVTISQSAVTLEDGSQVCGFQAGDIVTLETLINCLLVYSGNDAASAIAEYIGGTQDQFVAMMNEKAASLGMTGTHFTNPHGLQDENHYTTAYDIYLMLNEAMNNQSFLSIIQQGSYTASYTNQEGEEKAVYLEATDHYLTGEATPPKGVTVLGGKTGTTSEAGNCLALISQNQYGIPFISVISNASTKDILYQEMNTMLNQIN